LKKKLRESKPAIFASCWCTLPEG